MAQTKRHYADFGNYVAIPAGGDVTITLPETCNHILFIFEPTTRAAGYRLMLNPDDETNQGDATHDKHFIHIPDPPSSGTYLQFDDYFVKSFRLLGPDGDMFSYLGYITSNEPRTSYLYATP
jgi:hypothetical protein